MKTDARLRAERQRKWKIIHKAVREHLPRQGARLSGSGLAGYRLVRPATASSRPRELHSASSSPPTRSSTATLAVQNEPQVTERPVASGSRIAAALRALRIAATPRSRADRGQAPSGVPPPGPGRGEVEQEVGRLLVVDEGHVRRRRRCLQAVPAPCSPTDTRPRRALTSPSSSSRPWGNSGIRSCYRPGNLPVEACRRCRPAFLRRSRTGLDRAWIRRRRLIAETGGRRETARIRATLRSRARQVSAEFSGVGSHGPSSSCKGPFV